VYTATGDQALLLSRKCQLLQEEKQRRRMFETMEKKPIFIFTGRILLLCCSAGSVCKIDIKLYIVSCLEITATLLTSSLQNICNPINVLIFIQYVYSK
jgi:hypothetical protein